MRAVRSTRCPVIGHANFFFFFLYRRATRSDGIFIADLACLRNWTPTDGGSRPNPAAFIYAKRDQKRSTHVYRIARKNRQQLTATYPLKGMDDFHHTGRVRFATRGFWGKGVGFIISDNERCFTNDPIDSTRGEGGIFWNWDNREIFIPANNVPRSLSKHQDSLLSSIIEPGQRNFLIPSNVKRILEFYLAMNHSLRCFLLSSRERKTIKSRFKEPDSRDRIEINARIRWKGWRLAEKRAKLSFISRVLLPREYISPSLSLSLRRESSSALCCAPIKISAVNYAVPRRLLATVRPKTAKIKRTGRNVTCRV